MTTREFSPIYNHAYIDLRNKIYSLIEIDVSEDEWIQWIKERSKDLENFAERFTMMPYFWVQYLCYQKRLGFTEVDAIKKRALSDFYIPHWAGPNSFDLKWENHQRLVSGLLAAAKKDNVNQYEYYLTQPHEHLLTLLDHYYLLSRLAKPIPKSLIEKCHKAHADVVGILKAGPDDKAWLEAVMKLDNTDLAIRHIEYRLALSLHCLNKDIWKYYMNILKTEGSKALLDVYRRYTRFFIGDETMIEKYRLEIEAEHKKGLNVQKWWLDTIKYEMDFGTLQSACLVLERALLSTANMAVKILPVCNTSRFKAMLKAYSMKFQKTVEEESKSEDENIEQEPAITYPSFTTHFSQSFPFTPTLMNYIRIKAPALMLHKLFKTCKYFFAIQPTPVCYNLIIGSWQTTHYLEHSLYLNSKDLASCRFKNLIVANFLRFGHKDDRQALSRFLPKLHKVEAKYLHIMEQDITLKEYEFIAAASNIRWIRFYYTGVTNQNGEFIDVNTLVPSRTPLIKTEKIKYNYI